MNYICTICKVPKDENVIIEMSKFAFDSMKNKNANFTQFFKSDFEIKVHICKSCYYDYERNPK